mgnify:CR=1 FL=1
MTISKGGQEQTQQASKGKCSLRSVGPVNQTLSYDEEGESARLLFELGDKRLVNAHAEVLHLRAETALFAPFRINHPLPFACGAAAQQAHRNQAPGPSA